MQLTKIISESMTQLKKVSDAANDSSVAHDSSIVATKE